LKHGQYRLKKKPVLIKNITKVFTELGIPAQAVTILIHETPMENWGSAGEQHSLTYKEMKRLFYSYT